MMRSLFGLVLSICLSGIIMETVVDAATTGKISGVVTDGANGAPLSGVNVMLEGTRQGAVTQADGRYVILAVDPGVYVIRATMVGYGSEKRQNVRVMADYTATVNFSLKESTLDMDELVVTAK
ncbi:MAG: carboxypeptidase-like regulatory domain-containing protein, partial [Candidatus Latescibacteria bacterium]|nr:carboxypeptidase-like regulatory domain-containing protein [Candidatus Latescibacterota bacterium]